MKEIKIFFFHKNINYCIYINQIRFYQKFIKKNQKKKKRNLKAKIFFQKFK
jgi:hypothetical protein